MSLNSLKSRFLKLLKNLPFSGDDLALYDKIDSAANNLGVFPILNVLWVLAVCCFILSFILIINYY